MCLSLLYLKVSMLLSMCIHKPTLGLAACLLCIYLYGANSVNEQELVHQPFLSLNPCFIVHLPVWPEQYG